MIRNLPDDGDAKNCLNALAYTSIVPVEIALRPSRLRLAAWNGRDIDHQSHDSHTNCWMSLEELRPANGGVECRRKSIRCPVIASCNGDRYSVCRLDELFAPSAHRC